MFECWVQVEGLLDALAVEGVVPTEYESAQVVSPTLPVGSQ